MQWYLVLLKTVLRANYSKTTYNSRITWYLVLLSNKKYDLIRLKFYNVMIPQLLVPRQEIIILHLGNMLTLRQKSISAHRPAEDDLREAYHELLSSERPRRLSGMSSCSWAFSIPVRATGASLAIFAAEIELTLCLDTLGANLRSLSTGLPRTMVASFPIAAVSTAERLFEELPLREGC